MLFEMLGQAIERRFDRGIALCRSALRDDYENPEVYHNLGRVLLEFGRKSEGLRYLRRGLMVDPRNAAIQQEWRRLGVRQEPVLRFLPPLTITRKEIDLVVAALSDVLLKEAAAS